MNFQYPPTFGSPMPYGGAIAAGECDFRMGLEQNVPVSTTDQISKSVIYFNTIGKGRKLGLPNSAGTRFDVLTPRPFALGGLTGLTSARNYDVFCAYSTPTHSSTNTTTEIVTWSSNPGWTTGTYVIVCGTLNGLSVGTDYWYNRASSTTGSFHTTLVDAIAGTNKVNLTGNITQTLIGIYADLGPTWNAGAGAGSDTARGTGAGSSALAILDEANVNSVSITGSIGAGTIAASAGLYLGTVRTTGATTVEDSKTNRFAWNVYNQQLIAMNTGFVVNGHSYTTSAWREWMAGTGSVRLKFVLGLNSVFHYGGGAEAQASYVGGAVDSGDPPEMTQGAGGTIVRAGFGPIPIYLLGYHQIIPMEYGTGSSSIAFYQLHAFFMG